VVPLCIPKGGGSCKGGRVVRKKTLKEALPPIKGPPSFHFFLSFFFSFSPFLSLFLSSFFFVSPSTRNKLAQMGGNGKDTTIILVGA